MIGHLAWDPELRRGPTGRPWVRLGLVTGDDACPSPSGDLDGDDPGTDGRYDVMCFQALAEQVADLRAGTTVEIELGERCEERTWTGRDGEQRSTLQYVARSVKVLAEPSAEGVIRRILAAASVEEVLER